MGMTSSSSSSVIVGAIFIFMLCFCVSHVTCDETDHRYKAGDHVPFYANKVGPFHNPSETYRYFDLPFCLPDRVEEKNEALGEVLSGDRLVVGPYTLPFRADKYHKVLCKKRLNTIQVSQFRAAILKDYSYQMFYDDLPIWGFIGKYVTKEGQDGEHSLYKVYLFRHLHFRILYNKDRIIDVVVRSDPNKLADLTDGGEVDVDFSYSVKWLQTDTPFEKRMEKYSQTSTMPHQMDFHWIAIGNSCMIIIILAAFLAVVLIRSIKNDFVRVARDEEMGEDQIEVGWKRIHGDVFRYPRYKTLFAAAIGTGSQLASLAICIFILALVGVFYPYNRGSLLAALLIIHALTSGIAGFISASFYCMLEGQNWVMNLVLTGSLFTGPLFLTFCFLNTVAIAYNSTTALPFGTIVVIFLIWILVTSPLLALGGIFGRNRKLEFRAPCRTTRYPRAIPSQPWYRGTPTQMALGGIIPFCAINIELYYVFTSVWGHQIYAIHGTQFIVFIVLLAVTAFFTTALTYLQLSAEDHEWWWRSFFCGGSTGLFIFGYCLYYYFARSDMYGFMQTSFFFGYMACICYGFFLMLGTIGFIPSLIFVRRIYRSVKLD